MFRPFLVISFVSAATGALADPVPLTNDDLKRTVAGSTVAIDTPLGTTVPMRFGTDGFVSAEAGVLAPVLGSAKDRGRWWIDGDKLCTKWFRWFDAGVRCLTLARDGQRIHWRKTDDGETGTGTLVDWTPPAEKSTVVAKAQAPAKTPEPQAEKRATRLAVPPREVPTPTPPVPAERAPPAAASSPTVVARAEPDPEPAPELNGGPAMRFGGAGLLGSSALAAPAPETAADDAPATTARDVTPGQQSPGPPKPVTKLPAKDSTKDAATRKAPQTPAVHRQAALAAAAPVKTVAQPSRGPSATEWEGVNVATSSEVSLYRVRGVADYDVLNVRRGPSEQHAPIASIPPTGRRVEITGQCRADWCPIRYRGVTGWVNRYYLAEDRAGLGSASPVYRRR